MVGFLTILVVSTLPCVLQRCTKEIRYCRATLADYSADLRPFGICCTGEKCLAAYHSLLFKALRDLDVIQVARTLIASVLQHTSCIACHASMCVVGTASYFVVCFYGIVIFYRCVCF